MLTNNEHQMNVSDPEQMWIIRMLYSSIQRVSPRFRVRVRIRLRVRFRGGVRVRVRIMVRVFIKTISLSRYHLARKGILFGVQPWRRA